MREASPFAGRASMTAKVTGGSSIDFEWLATSIDLPLMLDREGIEIRNGKAFCPFHDNTMTPALSVFRADGRWRYRCHGCGMSGDGIEWVAAREKITTIEAARKLAGIVDYHVRPSPSSTPHPGRPEVPETWSDPSWQAAVDALVAESEARLWGSDGREALEWLRGRGLADRTIRRFRLGFVSSSFRSDHLPVLEDDRGPGRVYAPRGVTIPWLAPGACYSANEDVEVPRWAGCNIRRLAEPDVFAGLPEGVEKCMAVRGSRRGHLYPWPEVLPTQGELPMLLVEGEFDALIGFQEVGHRLHVATAGSASVKVLPLAARSALALSTWILLAFDHDRPGVKAVWEWRERFPHKSRRVLLPFGKDLSDFFNGGGDVRAWVAEIEQTLVTIAP
jgi:DNA primase